MAFVYATGGSELLIDACVVDMASSVVTPKDTRAGTCKNMRWGTGKLSTFTHRKIVKYPYSKIVKNQYGKIVNSFAIKFIAS